MLDGWERMETANLHEIYGITPGRIKKSIPTTYLRLSSELLLIISMRYILNFFLRKQHAIGLILML